MAEPLRLVIWSPSETTLDVAGLDWVHVELAGQGGLTIWPGHMPLIGELAPASIRYQDAEGEHVVSLPPGIVHVRDDTVTLFMISALDRPAREDEGQTGRFRRLAEEMIQALPRHGGAVRSGRRWARRP